MRGSRGSQGVCVVEGCDLVWRTKEMCQKHYDASRRSERRELARASRAKDPERFREYCRKSAQKHIYKRRTDAARRMIEKNHGIAYEEWQQRVDRPCAICGTENARMVLDHDHATGTIRDALCSNCNTALGLLKDNPGRMRDAAAYVELHRLEQIPFKHDGTLATDAREAEARA